MEHHVDEWISAYIDGELEEKERLLVKQHVQTCHRCEALLDDLLKLQSEVYTAFHSAEPPDYLEERILNVIIRNEKSNVYRSWLPIASILIVSFLALIVLHPAGTLLFKMISIVVKVMLSLLYAMQSLFTSEPYLVAVAIVFSVVLLGVSSFSLRRLLTTKAV